MIIGLDWLIDIILYLSINCKCKDVGISYVESKS